MKTRPDAPVGSSRPAPTLRSAAGRAGHLAGFCLIGLMAAPTCGWSWGSSAHRLINRNAVSCLPQEFQAFAQWAGDLEELSTDADQRKPYTPGESIKHYIDIDDYPEFFAGTFPHAYQDAVNKYGLSRLQSNGTGPWALEESFKQLIDDFIAGAWSDAVAAAADIGHYAGDLHQPLHLTTNYNGQETGNYGIHSRYESRLISRHLSEFTPPTAAALLADPRERTFQWIGVVYPGVAAIMAADHSAQEEANGDTYSDVYYDVMWELIGQDTSFWISEASRDVAAFWYTAWVQAGSPALPGTAPVVSATWGGVKALYVH